MNLKEYRRTISELEFQEEKAWRQFEQARDAGLDRYLQDTYHRRQQHYLSKIMKTHDAVMSEVVREQNAHRERAS